MINLEKDFIRYEKIGDSEYYGYTNNLLGGDSDNIWSIRRLSGTGSTFSNSWSNDDRLNYISKWSERVDYFSPPGGEEDFGLTYSISNSGSYEWRLFQKSNLDDGRLDEEDFNSLFSGEPFDSGEAFGLDINWQSPDFPEYLGLTESFALEIKTFLRIEVSGLYRFNTISDDGNQLSINGSVITSFYGGRGIGPGDISDDIFLTKGYHELIYRMEQGGGAAAAILKWKTPNSDEFVTIPSRFFDLQKSNFGDNPISDPFYALNVEWNDIPGYDIYLISIINDRLNVVDKNNIDIFNKWATPFTERIISRGTSKLNFRFFGKNDTNYLFKIESTKMGDTISATFSFKN
jgi:hypothetical protein